MNPPKVSRQEEVRQMLAKQEQKGAEITSNLEFTAFVRANAYFNARNYIEAMSEYQGFIRTYPLSTRVPIVQQRMADIDKVLAFQKAQDEAAKAKARAEAQEDAQLRAKYQTQASAPSPSAFSKTGTVTGTGATMGDAYAAARQRLPSGATELDITYSRGAIAHRLGEQGTGYRCKITYRSN